MTITIQHFEGCPNWRTAAAMVASLLAESSIPAAIEYELIETYEDAERAGFRGSPTILIDGADPFAEDSAPIGLACRIYRTEQGPAGLPSASMLRSALTVDRPR